MAASKNSIKFYFCCRYLPASGDLKSGIVFTLTLLDPQVILFATTKVSGSFRVTLFKIFFDASTQVMDRLFPLVPALLSTTGCFYLVVVAENKPGMIVNFYI